MQSTQQGWLVGFLGWGYPYLIERGFPEGINGIWTRGCFCWNFWSDQWLIGRGGACGFCCTGIFQNQQTTENEWENQVYMVLPQVTLHEVLRVGT